MKASLGRVDSRFSNLDPRGLEWGHNGEEVEFLRKNIKIHIFKKSSSQNPMHLAREV